MEIISHRYSTNESEVQSPIKSPSASLFRSSLHSSHTSFPIIAVAIICITATAFLLVSYYIFVIKCCLNWHRIDLLRRFSISRNRHAESPVTGSSQVAKSQGLDEAAIRSIPILAFDGKDGVKCSECAICLSKFLQQEKLRVIPNCSHVFHIDCIDVWLQNNANCPLCRTSISAVMPEMNFPLDPSQSCQDPSPQIHDSFRHEDYLVIEVGPEQGHPANPTLSRNKDSFNSDEPLRINYYSELNIARTKGRKSGHVICSMGDEWIDNRQKDEQFVVLPIRRSFSMDSADDAQLYLSVQEIMSKHAHVDSDFGTNEGCSSSNSKVKRSFFSFGQVKISKNAVQPVPLEP